AADWKRKPGRLPDSVNLFSGLLRNARDGDTFFVTKKAASKGGQRLLVNMGGAEGRIRHESFSAETLEWAILSKLAEVDPREILDTGDAPDEAAVLPGE